MQNFEYFFYLTKDKVAYLGYPHDVTSFDVEIIKHALEGIILRLKFEQMENEKNDHNKKTVDESTV